jgi:preprotein translocase subunit YajC
MKFSAAFASAIALATPALVFAQGASSANPKAQTINMFVMFGLVILIIYFLMIRPEQKKQKQRQALIANLQKGDKVLTSGGIIGTVGNVKDRAIVLKVGEGTVIEFTKSSIVSVLNEDGSEKVPEGAKPAAKSDKEDKQEKKA